MHAQIFTAVTRWHGTEACLTKSCPVEKAIVGQLSEDHR